MCGITGVLRRPGAPEPPPGAIEQATSALAHRGPDDSGIFRDGPISLGHRRLAIQDLSLAGHQPMVSADGRYALVFNGEIYNFRELRARLDYPFQSDGDSEVLLAAWQHWGAACIHDLIGMFAFAIWDRAENRLHLVRDRLGIKPLYYAVTERAVIFSSEVRSILSTGLIDRRVDRDSLIDYLRYQCVHTPATMIQQIRMLEPATHAVFKNDRMAFESYWPPSFTPPADCPRGLALREAVYSAMVKSVERRLISDVPFGAFLSGGIDSSALVALASTLHAGLKTFSVSFSESGFDEAHYARLVARRFGTEHHEIRLSPQEFLARVPEALDCMDHPSGDGPNTYVVSGATKRAGITVALSGLGGDELFAGYSVFGRMARLSRLRWIGAAPKWLRKGIGSALAALRPGIATAKLRDLLAAEQLTVEVAYPLYRQLFLDRQVRALVMGNELPTNAVLRAVESLAASDSGSVTSLFSRISRFEMATYMQNVLLRDTDQMSMAHALEVRVPFLDHELVELVLAAADHEKTAPPPKRLLVESLKGLLPEEIVNRPKMGFTLPYDRWMRRELRAFCETRILRLDERGLFRPQILRGYWGDFLAGRNGISWSRLWSLVALDHWLDRNGIEWLPE